MSEFTLTVSEAAAEEESEEGEEEGEAETEEVSELAYTGEFIFFDPTFLLEEDEEELAISFDKVTQTGLAYFSFNKVMQPIQNLNLFAD